MMRGVTDGAADGTAGGCVGMGTERAVANKGRAQKALHKISAKGLGGAGPWQQTSERLELTSGLQ